MYNLHVRFVTTKNRVKLKWTKAKIQRKLHVGFVPKIIKLALTHYRNQLTCITIGLTHVMLSINYFYHHTSRGNSTRPFIQLTYLMDSYLTLSVCLNCNGNDFKKTNTSYIINRFD